MRQRGSRRAERVCCRCQLVCFTRRVSLLSPSSSSRPPSFRLLAPLLSSLLSALAKEEGIRTGSNETPAEEAAQS